MRHFLLRFGPRIKWSKLLQAVRKKEEILGVFQHPGVFPFPPPPPPTSLVFFLCRLRSQIVRLLSVVEGSRAAGFGGWWSRDLKVVLIICKQGH